MGGVMTGALVLGGAADIFGRLKTVMMSLLGTIAFEGFSSYAPTFPIMVGLRYVGGICCALVILSSFVLSQELVGTNYRSTCGLLLSTFFAVGIGIFSAMAAFIPDWRTLSFICAVSGILFLPLCCLVPESPRWLVVAGQQVEAKKVLELIAKKNGKLDELPSHWEVTTSSGGEDSKVKNSQGMRNFIHHPYVLMLTLIQIYSWFVNSAVYYGLTMAASNLGGNVYLSTTLSGLIEIPSCLIAVAIIDRLGRRLTLSGFMLIGGAACLCIQLIPPSLVVYTTSLALFGKLSIASSFAVCYVHSAEIFPTPIRNSGMGIVSVAARIGGIVSPFILMLGDVFPNLQFTALGAMTFVSGLLNLKLPETMGQPMPESVADILALRNTTKGGGVEAYKYNKLQMDDEEVDVSVSPRAQSPRGVHKLKSEDQVPLITE
ncbi:solute carrier family 22 member 15-like isoform X2 [Palaemon carinicauda]